LYVDANKLRASICRDEFYEFVRRFWHVIVPEQPVWNWHIRFLCDELQTLAECVFQGKPKDHDLIVNISPGTTKSTICSVMFPAWTWTRMPTARSICGSYAYPLSQNLSRLSRNVVRSDLYRATFPEIQLAEDQDTKGHFANTQGGSRYCTSVGGSVTGMHGHFLIVDDPVDPLQALSEAELKTANQWMGEVLPTRKVDKDISVTILIMQRLHQDDPTGNRLEKGTSGLRHVCLPATDDFPINPPELIEKYVDGMMDPVRLNEAALESARTTLGDTKYAGQFGQQPVPLGGAMFQVGMLQIEPVCPPLMNEVRYWDKAGSKGRGCFTVGLKMGRDVDGHFWVTDIVRGQWDSAARERIIVNTAEKDGLRVVQVVEQEPGSGGKESAEATVGRLAGYRIRVDRPVGSKDERADPYSVQVNAGNVRLLKAPWNRDYVEELRFFPHSKYKDQVDGSSGAFAFVSKAKRRVGAA
jgi:predicted phage terminase large subunit-like protein